MTSQFEGTLDGRGLRSFQGDLERAGGRSYLLLGARLDPGAGPLEGLWILDLTAAAGDSLDQPGRTRFALTLVGPDGDRLTGPAVVIVRERDDIMQIEDLQAELLDPTGRVHRLAGRVRWSSPHDRPERVDGTLQLQVDDRQLPPAQASFLPFGEGWQAQVVLALGAGETIAAQVEIPSLDEGRHTPPQADLGLSWTRLDDQLQVDVLTLNSLQLTVTREGAHLSLRGEAAMASSHSASRVRVHFKGRVHP